MTKSRFAEKTHKLKVRVPRTSLFEFYTWIGELPLAVAACPVTYSTLRHCDFIVSSDEESLLVIVKLTWGGN